MYTWELTERDPDPQKLLVLMGARNVSIRLSLRLLGRSLRLRLAGAGGLCEDPWLDCWLMLLLAPCHESTTVKVQGGLQAAVKTCQGRWEEGFHRTSQSVSTLGPSASRLFKTLRKTLRRTWTKSLWKSPCPQISGGDDLRELCTALEAEIAQAAAMYQQFSCLSVWPLESVLGHCVEALIWVQQDWVGFSHIFCCVSLPMCPSVSCFTCTVLLVLQFLSEPCYRLPEQAMAYGCWGTCIDHLFYALARNCFPRRPAEIRMTLGYIVAPCCCI